MPNVQGGPKLGTLFVLLITSSNIDQFSLFFTVKIMKNCNNTITKDPITSQLCRYTTL